MGLWPCTTDHHCSSSPAKCLGAMKAFSMRPCARLLWSSALPLVRQLLHAFESGDSRLSSYCYLPLGPEWLVSFATTCQARQTSSFFSPQLGSCVRCRLGIFVYTVITVGWLVLAHELKLPLICCLETHPFCLSGFREEEKIFSILWWTTPNFCAVPTSCSVFSVVLFCFCVMTLLFATGIDQNLKQCTVKCSKHSMLWPTARPDKREERKKHENSWIVFKE